MVIKNCEICGEEFQVRPYRAITARFCGHRCCGAWHMSVREMPGDHKIGNKFREGLIPTNAFKKGHNLGVHLVNHIAITCKECKKVFSLVPWVARQNNPMFCGIACRDKHWKGKNHPLYIGGPITYRGQSWPKQRLLAVSRDGGSCVKCHRFIGNSIPVHHIKPYRDFQDHKKANRLSNLICLCQSCHMRIEPAGGRGKRRASV